MKKLIVLLLMLVVLGTVASAKTTEFEKSYYDGNQLVIASFNGTKPFFGDSANVKAVEESCYRLGETLDLLGVKYVSFIGNMSSGANFMYKDIIPQGGTHDDLYAANINDKEWKGDFEALKEAGSILTDSGLAYGVSLGLNDYCGNGYDRRNHIQTTFESVDFMGETNYGYEELDINNFAVTITVGKTRYIIYQLEAFPRQATLTWFDSMQAKHSDKRAIVFTTSLLDASGNMYTQHDWTVYPEDSQWKPIYLQYNTKMTTNLLHNDKPHDGDQLWKDALSKWDNLLCVVTSNATVGTKIVTSTLKNANGYDVFAVVANLEGGYANTGNAFPLMIRISEDGTVDLRYFDTNSRMTGYESSSRVTLKPEKLAKLPEPDPVTLLQKIKKQSGGSNKAYINGYAGNVFKPNATITRAEVFTIFARLLTGVQEIEGGNTTRFTDVSTDKWYYNATSYLDANGYFFTTTEDTLRPEENITRAEFVELAYFTSTLEAVGGVSFKDVDKSNRYYSAITAAASTGLVNGYGDGTFKPDATITRAEAVTIINRLIGLTANEKTVSREHLETVFSDIGGHWGEYQILMASNSNVKSKYYHNADLTSIKESTSGVWFETDYVKIEISKAGKVTAIINKATGENVNAATSNPFFTSLISNTGALVEPKKAELDGGRLKVTFKNNLEVYYIIEAASDHFTVTLDTDLPSSVNGAIICNLSVNSRWALDDGTSYGISGVPMTTTVNNHYIPGGASKAARGTVYTYLGVPTIGAKLGVAFSPMTKHREHLKSIAKKIDPTEGLVNTHGGPFAYDHEDIFGDYVITYSGLTPEVATETAKLANKYSIEQIDIIQGNNFVTADFNFIGAATPEEKKNGTFISATEFKKRIGDKIIAEGIQMGLHTYSSIIPVSATNILSNPKWQKQICYDEVTYTLRGDISKGRTSIKTNEDASKFEMAIDAVPWNNIHTKYILIDEEIILVQGATSSGFINVKRGQLGTKATSHKDGAEIRQFLCWYGMFQAKPLSELFYYLASETARAYNEGGFEMLYLDALESFDREGLCDKRTSYYIYSEFVRAVVSQCKKPPIVEYSTFGSYLWSARGRGGAVDNANRAYKNFKTAHVNNQKKYLDYFYTATLGWMSYCPDASARYKDTTTRSVYRDDLDHMGSLAIAYNFPTVCQSFSVNSFSAKTRLADNFGYYTFYTELRESNYFAPMVREQIKAGKYEYKVFRQIDGTFAFREMKYQKEKIFASDLATKTGANPFSAQTPFVRIEQRYSATDEGSVILKEFDENRAVTELVGTHSFTQVNVADKPSFKIRVYGNGSKTDAILLTLRGVVTGENGRNDYFIPLDFTGWRDITLIEANNDDYEGYSFNGISTGTVNYNTYRATVDLTRLNSATITLCGSCTGVKIDDLRACTPVDAPVKNPSITVGDTTLTFNAELHSSDYIEYYPDENKAYLNYYTNIYDQEGKWVRSEAHTCEITFTGSLKVPAGAFTYTYKAEPMTDNDMRAQVVLGYSGKIIANPESWKTPTITRSNEVNLY